MISIFQDIEWKQKHSFLSKQLFWIMPLILGMITGLVFAPWHYIWILFITIPLLLWIIDQQSSWVKVFIIGIFFSTGYYIDSFYWLIYAFINSAPIFHYLGFIAVLFVSIIIGSFISVAILCTYLVKKYLPLSIAFVFFFGLFDFLRMQLIPWNAIGYSAFAFLPLAQASSIIGIYGMNIVVLFPPALLYDSIKVTQPLYKRLYFALGAGLWLGLIFYGYGRLHTMPIKQFQSSTPVRLIATHFPQKEKWDIQYFNSHLQFIKKALIQLPKNGVVLFPETILPVDLTAANNQKIIAYIGNNIPLSSLWVIGSYRKSQQKYYNSLLFYRKHTQQVYIYDKRFLVPFAEYFPFQKLFSSKFFSSFTKGKHDFVYILKTSQKSLYIIPSICYEIAFPELLQSHSKVDVIIHSTNDAWFDASAEMYEHLDMARMRAIEQGVGVVISSNMGLNSIIDPLGRIVKQNQFSAYLDGYLPTGIYRYHKITIYKKFGNIGFFLILFLLIILGLSLHKITFIDKIS